MVREFLNQDQVMLDVWIEVLNTTDFQDLDLSKATHAHEFSEVGFYTEEEMKSCDVRPSEIWKWSQQREQISLI